MASQTYTSTSLTQPLSESYMHLSEDEITESSVNTGNTRKENKWENDEHATTSLLRIAKAIDGFSFDSNNEEIEKSETVSRPSPGTRKEEIIASDFFSSQSTPIAQKNTPAANKDRNLTPINEGRDKPKLNTDRDSFIKLDALRSLTYEDLESAKKVIDVLLKDKDLGKPKKEISNIGLHNNGPEFPVVSREEGDSFHLGNSGSQNKDSKDLNVNSGLDKSSEEKNDYDFLSSSPQISNLDHGEEGKDGVEGFKDSPLTSPPQSREILDSKNLAPGLHSNEASSSISSLSRDIASRDQDCVTGKKEHLRPAEAKESYFSDQTQLQSENINLQSKINDLESKLKSCTTELPNTSSVNVKIDSPEKGEYLENIQPQKSLGTPVTSSHEFELELENLKQLTQAQDGEIRVLRALRTNEVKREEEITTSKINDLILRLSQLNLQIGDTHALITKKNIPIKFHEYYDRFALDKVDSLSKTEMSNLIKNIMLSLLITDFNHLPEVSSKVGKFIRFLCLFMDRMHSTFFDDAHYTTRPSTYLRDYRYNIDDLRSCLDNLYNRVDKRLELSS